MIPLRDQVLVGRQAERAALEAGVAASTRGVGSCTVVIGEPGIGKSRLCRHVQERATDAGQVVLPGRAVDAGPTEPFRALAEALAVGFRAGGPPEDPSLLPFRGTLAHLLPGWAREPAPLTSVIALGEALLRLLAVTARDRGALLVVEDLHWADEDMLAVLEYLVDNADAHHAGLVLTLRPGSHGGAQRLARRLSERRAATLLTLDPLTPSETDELVRRCLDADAVPAELLDFVRERSDGVPFFVEELLLGLIRSGALVAGPRGWQLVASRLASSVPPALGDWIGQRFATLAPRTQRVVSVAALLGQPFDWSLLPRATGSDEATVLAALREATYAQLVVNDGSLLRFRHALTRDHILASLLPPERSELARAALEAVRSRHPDLPRHWCDLAAELAELAGDTLVAAEHLVESARRARHRGALSTAVARLERAIELLPAGSPDVRTAHALLAEVHALGGDVDAALAQARLASPMGPTVHAPDRVPDHALDPASDPASDHAPDGASDVGSEQTHPANGPTDLDVVLGHALLAAGRRGEAKRYVATVTGHLHGGGAGAALLLAAELAIAEQDLDRAHSLATEALGRDGVEPELACQALEVLGRCVRVRDVGEAERLFSRALETAERHGLVLWRARALHELGTIDLLDRMRVDRLRQARRAGIEAGAPSIAAVADLHLAAALVAREQPVAAREAAQRAEDLARRLGHAVEPWATMLIARTYAHERRAVDAEEAIGRALATSDDPALRAQADGHVRAMLALHLADRDAALVALDRAAALLRRLPGQHDPHRGLWALLRTLARIGDTAARTEAASAAGSGTRFNQAMLLVAEAVAAGRDGDVALAAARHAEGMSVLAGYEHVGFLTHLTDWLTAPVAFADGWGDPVEWLQQAVRWFADHGHDPLASSCRTSLRDVGAPIPRRGRGGVVVPPALRRQGVTSREADVLWLLAEHLTNAQIADRLVLSPRTVEKHVAALLRKTGCTDRRALGRLAGELGATTSS